MERGVFNPARSLETQGVTGLKAAHYNLLEPALMQEAVQRGEGEIGRGGAFLVSTGKHTGRSPQDKFVVREPSVEDTIWWENNKPMDPAGFAALKADMFAHLEGRELFVQDLFGGADPAHRLNVRVATELAWHNLFIRHLLRRPEQSELESFDPEFTIINVPSFKADPAKHACRSETVIAISLEEKLILIGGTSYAGENKKSVFTLLNYILPGKGVMAMHCSANHAIGDPEDAAVFFGLSGTGKTTLSADPSRILIGDDEHGWTDQGIFNYEGGCYAKTIDLSAEAEPEIFATTSMFSTVVMLTCDAFGVLPPIARLTPAQAMYHFLSGFTSKVAGTEKGVTEPSPTFSTCFGQPFMPRRPEVYGALLRDKIAQHGATCWLVNTGWTGGAYGTGKRMPIKATRALLTGALDGSLNGAEFRKDPFFGFEVPVAVPGVDSSLLNPRDTWADKAAYDAQAAKLAKMFAENFAQYDPFVGDEVRAAAPGKVA